MGRLSDIQLEELRFFDTPTVSNAIEAFGVRSVEEGFMDPTIRPQTALEKPMVGYAFTAKMSARKPPTDEEKKILESYYKTMYETPNPLVVVIQDLDDPPFGSFWGEVNASIHKSLGCVGVITSGGVRDLDEVSRMGFGYFASCVLVSHANRHITEFGGSVEVGGLTVSPGDLLHADKHGVVLIPAEIAHLVADACKKMQYAEAPVIENCRLRNYNSVTLLELMDWRKEMNVRRRGAAEKK